MEPEEIKARFRAIHPSPGKPHKGLLALWALSRLYADLPRIVKYEELEGPLTELLDRFGSDALTPAPNLPYWWLQQPGGVWEVLGAENLVRKKGSSIPLTTELRKTSGGLIAEVDAGLRKDDLLLKEVIEELLVRFIKPSERSAIVEELSLGTIVTLESKEVADERALRNRIDRIDRIEQVFSDSCGPCPVCGETDLSAPGNPNLASVTNQMIEHGWLVLHVGQQSMMNDRGEILQQTTVVMGRPEDAQDLAPGGH
jgi:hypothetical protein